MEFKKYPSIENSYREKFLNSVIMEGLTTVPWVVVEKIHGCLEYNTTVETKEFGVMCIGDIVKKRNPVHVKSFNFETKEIEWKLVTGFSEQPDIENWYIIELDDGRELTVTGNHLIWVENENKYKPVEELNETDIVKICNS